MNTELAASLPVSSKDFDWKELESPTHSNQALWFGEIGRGVSKCVLGT